jgi:hypothetical protein
VALVYVPQTTGGRAALNLMCLLSISECGDCHVSATCELEIAIEGGKSQRRLSAPDNPMAMLLAASAAPSFVPQGAYHGVRHTPVHAVTMNADEFALEPGETAVTKPLPPYTTMVVGDKTLAGDFGFDPLLIADNPKKLAWFRFAIGDRTRSLARADTANVPGFVCTALEQ